MPDASSTELLGRITFGPSLTPGLAQTHRVVEGMRVAEVPRAEEGERPRMTDGQLRHALLAKEAKFERRHLELKGRYDALEARVAQMEAGRCSSDWLEVGP